MADAPPAPSPPKIDKAHLLGSCYQYLAGRLESVGRRSSLTMVFLASFLGFTTSPVLRAEALTPAGKLAFALTHPSILVGVLGMLVLLWSELAKIRGSDDIFSKIAFTEGELAPLQAAYVASPTDTLFEHLIVNIRVVGTFLRRKVMLYNTGCALFVISVTLFVLGF